MKRPGFYRLAVFCLSIFMTLLALPAIAATTLPSRDSLIGYWEQQVKKDPNVTTLEKTDQPDIYKFQTTLFPYKGRLKVLNAAITEDLDGEYYAGLVTGIVETELLDAKPDFYQKYAKSYEAWNRGGYFYYDPKKNAWFNPTELSAHYSSAAQKPKQCLWQTLSGPIGSLLVIVFILIVLVLAVRKGNKRVWDRNNEIFENQKKAILNGEKVLEQTLAQTKLLQSILEELKKKQ